ncbi:SRPBCC family protein [Halobacillus sp. A1]|uniref:SRPBCC family protein n=1 Tax=Halobacillus sp. A1 TaxID=2880262 RepID=UPI0020A672FF|nr:SRPBCC family protein [Halobacillus sp. A1]MCP3030960.1 SRPBCC family protein [Halobacillus sp. A1]
MPFLERTVIIKKPLEEVFQTATNFEISPQIMEAVVEVEPLTEGPVRKGYQFKEVREIRGRRAASTIEITDFDSNKSYTASSEQNGLELHYHYTFLETTEGTKVSFTGELFTKGLRNKLAKPMIKKIIKKEDQNHLDKMKDFIEKQ